MFLGIDTSCYTTSLAVVDNQGRLLADERILLTVGPGERGLRQSDGLFQHVQNLPHVAQRTRDALGGSMQLQGIAASSRPRPIEGSYMPVFTAGTSFGQALSALLDVPFVELSHQEGHLIAGMWSADVTWQDFYLVHVSGGTTEILDVAMDRQIHISKVGGSADLHAGQFIDRIGVALELPFPAGPHLEMLAKTAAEVTEVPVSVQGTTISFSGPESHVQRLIQQGQVTRAAIARGVERSIAEALWRIVHNANKKLGTKKVLFVGGVMANHYVRDYLHVRLQEQCAFAQNEYAGDNAVGAALNAWKTLTEPDI